MLPITSSTAALAAIGLVALSIPVSLQRMKVGVNVGMGGDETLLRRIRAQGNFVEYVPIALILLGLAEFRDVAASWVWAIAGLIVVGRCLHAAGMLTGRSVIRAPGMVCTYLSLLAGAAALAIG